MIAFVAAAAFLPALRPAAIAADAYSSRLSSATILRNASTWVLQGKKLPSGACRYDYSSAEAIIPASGWELRSVAIDMKNCRKLIEQGEPAEAFTPDTGAIAAVETIGESGAAKVAATASTKGAWQRVIWRDLGGVLVNADLTQINWTYNGTTSTLGSTTGGWFYNTATGWQLGAHTLTELYGPSSSYYRGQTTATFINSYFCNQPGAKTVYTYYYYNRMWGHPNGTATRSQDSDSVDECLPLHIDIQSAYGQWNG